MEKKFSFVELISLIVIIAVVVMFAISCALPKTREARESAFRLEATKMVAAAEKAVFNNKEGKLKIENNKNSYKSDDIYCFTVKDLMDRELYSGNKKYYSGKVLIDYTDKDDPQYTVYFKKNDEFKIIGGFRKDYSDYGVLSVQTWNEDYESCFIE